MTSRMRLPKIISVQVLAMAPITELQRWSVADTRNEMFSSELLRQILQLRYQLTNEQLREHYDKFLLLPLPFTFTAIEAAARLAACFGEPSYQLHWHYDIFSCMLLAVHNENIILLQHYIQYMPDVTFRQVKYISALLYEILKSDNTDILALFLVKVHAMDRGFRPELSSYPYGLSKKSFDVLYHVFSTNARENPSFEYYYLCGYNRIANFAVIPPVTYADNDEEQIISYLLGQWHAGQHDLGELYKHIPHGHEVLISMAINILISRLDQYIISALGEATVVSLPYTYALNEFDSLIITVDMVQRAKEFAHDVEEFLTDNTERASLLVYIDLLQHKPVADAILENLSPDWSMLCHNTMYAMGYGNPTSDMTTVFSEVAYGTNLSTSDERNAVKHYFHAFYSSNEEWTMHLDYSKILEVQQLVWNRYGNINLIAYEMYDPEIFFTKLNSEPKLAAHSTGHDRLPLPKTSAIAASWAELIPDLDTGYFYPNREITINVIIPMPDGSTSTIIRQSPMAKEKVRLPIAETLATLQKYIIATAVAEEKMISSLLVPLP